MDVIFFLMETSNVSSKKTFFIFSIPPMFDCASDHGSLEYGVEFVPPPKKKNKRKTSDSSGKCKCKTETEKSDKLFNFLCICR